MDNKNRLTKNGEWEVGARYRYLKGKPNKWTRQVYTPPEGTFLGWADNGRLHGVAMIQLPQGPITTFPKSWRNRWVKIAPAASLATE